MRSIAVFDVDGVLADVRHRLHHLESTPKNWFEFFAEADRDGVLREGATLLAALAPTHEIRYLTGRPEVTRDLTRDWLARHDLPDGDLVMRPDTDRRPARMFKRDRLRRWMQAGDHLAVVVDDDPLVVEMIDSLGLTVVHATWQGSEDGQQVLWDAQERLGLT